MADLHSKVTRRPRSKLQRLLGVLESTNPVADRPADGLIPAIVRSYGNEAGLALGATESLIRAVVGAAKLERAAVERALADAALDAEASARLVEDLRAVLQMALDGLEKVCKNDVEEGRKRLTTLPRFSVARADFVLLESGFAPSVAPSGDALRVAARLGYPGVNYAAVARALDAEIPEGDKTDIAWRAHHALAAHGRDVCFRIEPACNRCRVKASCSYKGVHADPAHRLRTAGS